MDTRVYRYIKLMYIDDSKSYICAMNKYVHTTIGNGKKKEKSLRCALCTVPAVSTRT